MGKHKKAEGYASVPFGFLLFKTSSSTGQLFIDIISVEQ